MAIRKSSSSGIPFGNTAGRPANPGLGQLYSNGQAGRLELYTEAGWQNIVQETPGIASITGTYNESAGSGTFVISGTNFVSGGIAYAVGTNGTEYQATTSTTNSVVQMTAVFTGLSPAYEPYDIKVLNPSNLFGLLADAFYINDSPVWSTSSGSLGTYTGSSIQLSATDDESNTITYSVTSGSLPTGLSLSSAGLISGTNTATAGTYTFTVSASDGINTAVTRSFSIVIPFPAVTGGTLSSDATYYYRSFTASSNLVVSSNSLPCDYLIVAGGGGGGAYHAGGGGAGGYISSNSILLPNTYSITIGAGGLVGDDGSYEGTKGNDSSFNSLTSFGGGRGVRQGSTTNSNHDGGSGGGAADGVSRAATGVVGQGYNGGYTSGGGNTYVYSYATGGGGGAGGPGISPNTVTTSGGGGPGLQWLNGSYYSGGGGGGNLSQSATLTAGIGGVGGGGTSGLKEGTTLHRGLQNAQGVINTGGGGAGHLYNLGGGSGGSGIVIVRYTKASVGG
jgi:hypothetical protein